MDKVSARSIIEFLQKSIEDKKQLDKDVYLDAALKLTILSLDENELLSRMEKELAQKKAEMWKNQEKKNISEIEMLSDSLPETEKIKNQKFFLKTIEEMIRVSKLIARLNEFV